MVPLPPEHPEPPPVAAGDVLIAGALACTTIYSALWVAVIFSAILLIFKT